MTVAAHPCSRFQGLSEAQRRALRMMQVVNFGRVSFRVLRGEPDLAQPWRTRQTVKLASGENGPRPETNLADFELCRQQTALLDALRHVSDGACVAVEVRHGMPFLVEIEQDHQAA